MALISDYQYNVNQTKMVHIKYWIILIEFHRELDIKVELRLYRKKNSIASLNNFIFNVTR